MRNKKILLVLVIWLVVLTFSIGAASTATSSAIFVDNMGKEDHFAKIGLV